MASTSTAQASIYFERQPPGSMLCAVNALNNLVQNGLYSAAELAAIGKQLDDLEAEQLGGAIGRESVARGQEGMNAELSNNFDDSGFFSQAVVDGALRIYGLRLASWASEEMQPLHNFPEHQMAFLINLDHHWFVLRKFANCAEFWYCLDSLQPQPTPVSTMFLGMMIHQAQRDGYSVFAVVSEQGPLAMGESLLPHCAADEEFGKQLSQLAEVPSAASSSTATSKRKAFDDDEEMVAGPSNPKRYRPSPSVSGESGDEGFVAAMKATAIDPDADLRRAIEQSLQEGDAAEVLRGSSATPSAPVAPNSSPEFVDEPSIEQCVSMLVLVDAHRLRALRLARFG